MSRSVLVVFVAVVLGLASCDTRSPRGPDGTAIDPGATSYTDTTTIRRRVDSIVAFARSHPERRRVFALPSGASALVVVKDSLSWPADVEASFNIVYDSNDAILLHREMPYSESGDWHMESEHYFDAQGRTIMHRAHVASFGSGCAEIMRETTRTFFDPSTGAILGRTTEVTGDERKPIADPSQCNLRGVDVPGPRRALADLLVP